MKYIHSKHRTGRLVHKVNDSKLNQIITTTKCSQLFRNSISILTDTLPESKRKCKYCFKGEL